MTANNKTPGMLEFYFDYISPNAYLAWPRVVDIARRHNLELSPRPVLFAGLLHAHQQVGPAEVQPKMQWMVRNCLRKAHHTGVVLKAPASHPFNPLAALRITQALAGDLQQISVIDAIFRAAWAQSRDISDRNELHGILSDVGCDADAVLERAGVQGVKDALRHGTDKAIDDGVFGVPIMVVAGELFFGYDDIEWLERFLRGEAHITDTEFASWNAVRASAWRHKK